MGKNRLEAFSDGVIAILTIWCWNFIGTSSSMRITIRATPQSRKHQ
jgi:uncharacterized membrane protein